MKILISKLFISTTILFFISCFSEQEFQQIEYNSKEDIMGQIARGFIPENNIEQWALIKGDNFSKKTSVLFNSSNMEENNLTYFSDGFFNACHPLGCSYYIVTKLNNNIKYITDKEKLTKFLGKIDSMEEALLIAILNDFDLDPNNKKGSSYRMTSSGYEFLLMKSHPISIQFQQYFVSVDKYGNLKSEPMEIYCEGFSDCYE